MAFSLANAQNIFCSNNHDIFSSRDYLTDKTRKFSKDSAGSSKSNISQCLDEHNSEQKNAKLSREHVAQFIGSQLQKVYCEYEQCISRQPEPTNECCRSSDISHPSPVKPLVFIDNLLSGPNTTQSEKIALFSLVDINVRNNSFQTRKSILSKKNLDTKEMHDVFVGCCLSESDKLDIEKKIRDMDDSITNVVILTSTPFFSTKKVNLLFTKEEENVVLENFDNAFLNDDNKLVISWFLNLLMDWKQRDQISSSNNKQIIFVSGSDLYSNSSTTSNQPALAPGSTTKIDYSIKNPNSPQKSSSPLKRSSQTIKRGVFGQQLIAGPVNGFPDNIAQLLNGSRYKKYVDDLSNIDKRTSAEFTSSNCGCINYGVMR